MAAVPAVAVYCVQSVGLPLQTPARPGCDPQNYGLLQRYDTNYAFYSSALRLYSGFICLHVHTVVCVINNLCIEFALLI